MFKSFPPSLSFDELKQHKSLYAHAQKMESVLELLLAQVGQEKKFIQTLLEYGKIHTTFGADGKYAKVKLTPIYPSSHRVVTTHPTGSSLCGRVCL